MVAAPDVKFEILRMPPENTNSVLVSSGRDAVIFDPWGRADDWVRVLDARGLTLRAIYATHGHPDHISAAAPLSEKYDAPFYMAAADRQLLGWGGEILDFFEIPRLPDNIETIDAPIGATEILNGIPMEIVAAPGHTPGGVYYYFPNEKILLTGDTIFRDGVGRTDFPGGDATALRNSIYHLMDMNLPDETFIVHGHGNDSTFGWLRENHPYFLIRHCRCGDGRCGCGACHHDCHDDCDCEHGHGHCHCKHE